MVLAPRGEHQHRCRKQRSDAPEHVETIHPRQHHVQHHRIPRPADNLRQGRRTVMDRGHLEILGGQVFGEQLAQLGVIVDEQDTRHHWSMTSVVTAPYLPHSGAVLSLRKCPSYGLRNSLQFLAA
jgi:hypothetical protein